MAITIIVPVKDEEDGLQYLLGDYEKSNLKIDFDISFIFVIDQRTSDSSKLHAKNFSDNIIDQRDTTGKGAAVSQAVALWKQRPTEFVVFLDADGSYSFESVRRVIAELKEGAEIVSGSRFIGVQGRPKGMTRLHYLGNKALSFISSIRNGRKISDLCTGLWGFREDALQQLSFDSSGFDLEAEISGLARRKSLEHREVRVDWSQRKGGTSKLRSISDGIIIFFRIMRT